MPFAQDKIKIKEIHSGEILETFSPEQEEEAFAYATQMEELGISVSIEKPTVLHSLSNALGLSEDDQDLLFSSADQELDDHQDSCGYKKC